MSPYRDGVLEWHVELQSPNGNIPEIAVRLYGEPEWWWLKLNLIPLLPSLNLLAPDRVVTDRADLQAIIDALGAVSGLLNTTPAESVIAAGYRRDPRTLQPTEQRFLKVDRGKLHVVTSAVREMCSYALATDCRVVFKSDRWG